MRANFDRLGPPPRPLPSSVRLGLTYGGQLFVIGLFILLVLTPFAWMFGLNADVSGPLLFRGALAQVDGTVTEARKTAASEGRSTIWKVTARYTPPGAQPLSSTSYVRGFSKAVGDTVTLEYPAGRPDVARIVGSRRALFGPGAVIVFLVYLIVLLITVAAARRGARDARLLRDGVFVQARFLGATETGSSVDRRPVMALRFAFHGTDGAEHELVHETSRPAELTDEKRELVVYLPEAPQQGRVVDGLPDSVVADASGALAHTGSGLKMALGLAVLLALANATCGVVRLVG